MLFVKRDTAVICVCINCSVACIIELVSCSYDSISKCLFCSSMSSYYLQATGDPYYLDVGKSVIENLDRLARVPCGFAAIKDVTSGTHEDQYVMHVTHFCLCCTFVTRLSL